MGRLLKCKRKSDNKLVYAQLMPDYGHINDIIIETYLVPYQPGDYALLWPMEGWEVCSATNFPLLYDVLSEQEPNLQLGTITTPVRALNTVWRPNLAHAVYVSYSVRVSSTLSLVAGSAGRAELRIGASSPPTDVYGRVAGGSTGALAVGLNIADIAEGQLSAIVPAGHYVSIVTVAETGTPTFALTAQKEQVL